MQLLPTRALWTCLAACLVSLPAASAAQADPATLTAYHWQLREVRDAQGGVQPGWSLPPVIPGVGAGRPVLLSFAQERVTVRRLCNALSANYWLQGQKLHIDTLYGTRRACPEAGVMALEQRIGPRLPEVSQWHIETQGLPAPVLTLVFADGGKWLLDGAPTDATRYGSPGERMFLEVGPERVACSHPLIPKYRCLQVRKLEYDAQGLKTQLGAWENWYGEIQGYVHEPGVRNVLRILRYPNASAPADAPAFNYVLDMTVETEIMR
ncbi:MAG: META and DUF4377 domain-containing protein [Comamonas sp.]